MILDSVVIELQGMAGAGVAEKVVFAAIGDFSNCLPHSCVRSLAAASLS